MKFDLPKGYRIVPSYPDYAISEKGEVLNVRTHYLLAPWKDSDGEEKLVIYTIDKESNRNRRTVVKVSDMIQEAAEFDATQNRYSVTVNFEHSSQVFSVHRDELGNFIKAIDWHSGSAKNLSVTPDASLAMWEFLILKGAEQEKAERAVELSENEWRVVPGYPDVETDIHGNVRHTDDQTYVPSGGDSPRGLVHYHLENPEGEVVTYSRETIVDMAFPELRLKKD